MTIDTQTLLQHITDHPGQTLIDMERFFKLSNIFEISGPLNELVKSEQVIGKLVRGRPRQYYAVVPRSAA